MERCSNCGSRRIAEYESIEILDAHSVICIDCETVFIQVEPDGDWVPQDQARRCETCGLYYDVDDFQQVPWGNPGEEACTSCATGVGDGK